MHNRKCTGIDLNIACVHIIINYLKFTTYVKCIWIYVLCAKKKINSSPRFVADDLDIVFLDSAYYLKYLTDITWKRITSVPKFHRFIKFFWRVIDYLCNTTSNFNRIIMLFILSYRWKGNNLKLRFFWTIFRIKLF